MFETHNNRFLDLNHIYKLEQFEENLTVRCTLTMKYVKDLYSKNYIRNEVNADVTNHLLAYYREHYDDYTPI